MEVAFDTKAFDEAIEGMEERLKELGKRQIEIGVLDEDEELQKIAYVHEYGFTIDVSDKMRAWFAYKGFPLKKTTTQIVIPERSYMRSGIKENKGEIKSKVKMMLPSVISGGVSVDLFLEEIGEEFAGLIQKNLRDLKEPPNSEMTKKMKESSNPLIDSGGLMGAIRSEVK